VQGQVMSVCKSQKETTKACFSVCRRLCVAPYDSHHYHQPDLGLRVMWL